MKIDYKKLKKAKNYIRKINHYNLHNLNMSEIPNSHLITTEMLDEFSFCGLNNVDFIFSDFRENYKK